MVLNVHRNRTAYYGRGEGGKGYGGGGRGRLYTYRYTVTTRMTPPLKMGSDESHFNVAIMVRYKVTRQRSQTTTLLKRKDSRSGESNRRPSAYRRGEKKS